MKFVPRFPIRNTRVVSRVAEILHLCTNKKILHLGCADAPYTVQRGEDLLHKRLAQVTHPDMLWGLDISAEGIQLLHDMGFDHVFHDNVEQMDRHFKAVDFDIVLAGEIIEHLANPGLFLKAVASMMRDSTELMVTTPNAFAFKGFVHSLMWREKVHPDHNYYFSYRTLKQLLEKADLKCREIYYYQEVEGHGVSKALDKTISVVTRISPLWADGLIVRATLC